MSGFSTSDGNEQFERAKKKYHKMTMLNQIIDDHSQMRPDEKINAIVLIAKSLIEEQTKFEKSLALKEEKERQMAEEISYKNKVIQKYQDGLLKAKSDYYELEKNHQKLVQKCQEKEVVLKEQASVFEDDKYSSNRKILSMQNQVNFLLQKDSSAELTKIAEKMKKQNKKGIVDQENNIKVKKSVSKSQLKTFSKRRQSVK